MVGGYKIGDKVVITSTIYNRVKNGEIGKVTGFIEMTIIIVDFDSERCNYPFFATEIRLATKLDKALS